MQELSQRTSVYTEFDFEPCLWEISKVALGPLGKFQIFNLPCDCFKGVLKCFERFGFSVLYKWRNNECAALFFTEDTVQFARRQGADRDQAVKCWMPEFSVIYDFVFYPQEMSTKVSTFWWRVRALSRYLFCKSQRDRNLCTESSKGSLPKVWFWCSRRHHKTLILDTPWAPRADRG